MHASFPPYSKRENGDLEPSRIATPEEMEWLAELKRAQSSMDTPNLPPNCDGFGPYN